MSRAPRAEFSFQGELYVALAAWAAEGVELSGYERLAPARARQILAALPRQFEQHPGVRVMLAGAGRPRPSPVPSPSSRPIQSPVPSPRSSPEPAPRPCLGRAEPERCELVLYRRARVETRPFASELELDIERAPLEPEPPPLLDLRVELAGQAAIAATLLAAAANGAPFCQKCEDCR